jgi:hypothetical protein
VPGTVISGYDNQPTRDRIDCYYQVLVIAKGNVSRTTPVGRRRSGCCNQNIVIRDIVTDSFDCILRLEALEGSLWLTDTSGTYETGLVHTSDSSSNRAMYRYARSLYPYPLGRHASAS